MLRVGIIGLGFMGSQHFRAWKDTANAELVAVCDIDPEKFTGAGTGGNIAGGENALDLTGIATYTDIGTMLAEAQLDAISVTLPTYLHADATVKCLQAGLNVLCEKPMAINVEDAQRMAAAAKETGKILQVGHCIRFWPEYAKTKEIIDSGEYGKLQAATFTRLSATPRWSWQSWILEGPKSGGAALDLHIHDADFVQYLLGMPQAVFSQAVTGPSGDQDHITTQYIYDKGPAVTAEGGWMMTDGYGFKMAFSIVLEKAAIVFDITADPAFKVCPDQGEPFTPDVAVGDGYSLEIAHFARACAGESVPAVLTPEQSCDSMRLVLAEKASADSGAIEKL